MAWAPDNAQACVSHTKLNAVRGERQIQLGSVGCALDKGLKAAPPDPHTHKTNPQYLTFVGMQIILLHGCNRQISSETPEIFSRRF